MIIDSHAHLMGPNFLAEAYWDNWVKLFSTLSNRPSEIIRKRLPEFWDETGELLIKDMNGAGIDQSWISVLDLGIVKTVGEARYSITEINKIYAEIAHKYGERLLAFVGIDPRREGAVEMLDTGIKEWGMKGLKLIPATGFYPNSESCYKLYEKADELGIPVLVHTGPEAIPLYSKYCYPVYLDEVANDFPNLILILAHAGFCWWQEALNVASTKPNVYIDLAGWQPKTYRNPINEFYIPLRTILDTIGPSRVLFGSDWPALRLFKGGQTDWVRVFRNPHDTLKERDINFTRDEIKAILGGNAAKIISKGEEK